MVVSHDRSIMVYQMELLYMECLPISGEETMNSYILIAASYKRMRLYIGQGAQVITHIHTAGYAVVSSDNLLLGLLFRAEQSPLHFSFLHLRPCGYPRTTVQGPPTISLLLTSANIY